MVSPRAENAQVNGEILHTGRTYYFKYRGEINTDLVIEIATRRAEELGIGKLVVASETGRSALKALKVAKGRDLKLIVVTHPPAKTWGPRGDIPIGLGRPEYARVRKCLEEGGAIIVQGTRPLAPISRSLGWNAPLPEVLIDKTLGMVFGQGVKISIEAALMACDAGAVDRGEVVVSMAGTYKGLDTALVVRTTYTYLFLDEFEVLEILAKPWEGKPRYPEHGDPGWRGNLEQYYAEPTC